MSGCDEQRWVRVMQRSWKICATVYLLIFRSEHGLRRASCSEAVKTMESCIQYESLAPSRDETIERCEKTSTSTSGRSSTALPLLLLALER